MRTEFKILILLSGLIVSSSVFADGPRKSPWNPSAAKNYAERYALNPNPNYHYFSNDCTNFVSQIMKAGGWRFTDSKVSTQAHSWYYHNSRDYAQTWTTAHGFRNRLNYGYEKGAEKVSGSYGGLGPDYLNNKLREGDVILADWTGDGRYDHAMSVRRKGWTDTIVAYHSRDVLNGSMSNISSSYPNMDISVYHIE